MDFTDPGTDTYGTDAQKSVSGTMVLWPGNVVLDNVVRCTGANNDRDPILVLAGISEPTNTVDDEYFLENVNLDAVVRYMGPDNDREPIQQTVGATVPTNTCAA